MKRVLVPMLLVALVGGVVATAAVLLIGPSGRGASPRTSGGRFASAPLGTRRVVSSTALSATQIYQRDSTGVVAIKAITPEGEDEGTGIVLNGKGLILTNDHVVKGAKATLSAPPATNRPEWAAAEAGS